MVEAKAQRFAGIRPPRTNREAPVQTGVSEPDPVFQKLGRGYVGQFNARHRRTGTLWEGRYKASLVDSENYVLHCQRYIDLNPVRARMTDDPANYPWSSCPAHCGRRPDAMLTPHPA